MTLSDEYLEESITFIKKYGENTAVLMQVGHFYEAYALDTPEENINADNLRRMANIMNIQMTRKNKNIVEISRKNPMMIGVNIYSIDKFVQLLLNKFYTIVIIDQTCQTPFVKREVTNIYSPGTNIKY
jgi:Mismatch repair ATPase (MutS family)